MNYEHDKDEIAENLKASFLEFTKFFFPILTGREFVISNPVGRESHHITIARELTKCFWLEIPTQRLNINIEPGSGKSTLLSFWAAWCFAHYADCRFLYISYSKDLATTHTANIKRILQLAHYKHLFGVTIMADSKAKEFFETTKGGAVASFGSAGAVTGRDGGYPNENRFSGAVIVDDAHKPSEATSDVIRTSVIDNYDDTIRQRVRGLNVPIIHIGQRVHEDDLANYFLSGNDTDAWSSLVLPSLDQAGNALYPEKTPKHKLLALQEKSPYVFASQYQQNPIPAGGSLFKPEWFILLDEEPDILATFIVCDTAETSKSWNDATVFSFFGMYQIEEFGRKTNEYGLHWLDCVELRIEPKDLEINFLDFTQECMRHPAKPSSAWIEKKSTGSTLVSVLKEKMRTIQIREIERNRSSGSKTERFLRTQPYVAGKKVSFTKGCKHYTMCVDHMSKITANEVHRWDDIADTLSDGVKIGLIDKMLVSNYIKEQQYTEVAKTITSTQNKINRLRKSAYTR